MRNQTPTITPMHSSDIHSQFVTTQDMAIIAMPPMAGVNTPCFLP